MNNEIKTTIEKLLNSIKANENAEDRLQLSHAVLCILIYFDTVKNIEKA